MMADVRFSRPYSAVGSVAGAWMVAWWGLIFGLGRAPIRVVDVAPVAILAVSESVVDARDVVRFETGVVAGAAEAEGSAVPVSAVQMAAMGGSGSDQGTVKSGLSQRLCVLGSSYRKMRLLRSSGG